ncbi:hypothetical protein [uncultured Caulobacter sp.]|uniref:hypothetical protein n=1 Tax=uncultured Caulobacter sp. TaxID=158749 RepID=UPI002613C1D4|nr:hypothetical protein [uncultured Caulobacter sp.]
MAEQDEIGRRVAKLFGAFLMAVGVLIAGLCGLCSATVLVMMAGPQGKGLISALLLVAVFGGVPIATGVALFRVGRAMWRD